MTTDNEPEQHGSDNEPEQTGGAIIWITAIILFAVLLLAIWMIVDYGAGRMVLP